MGPNGAEKFVRKENLSGFKNHPGFSSETILVGGDRKTIKINLGLILVIPVSDSLKLFKNEPSSSIKMDRAESLLQKDEDFNMCKYCGDDQRINHPLYFKRDDSSRFLLYPWRDHCFKGFRVETTEDFEFICKDSDRRKGWTNSGSRADHVSFGVMVPRDWEGWKGRVAQPR